MRTHAPNRPPRSFTVVNWVQTIAIVALSTALLIAMWPFVWTSLFGTKTPALPITIPTAAVQVRPQPVLAAPVSIPTPAAEFAPVDVPLQNVLPADDPTPPALVVKPAPERWVAPPGTVPTEDAEHGVRDGEVFNPQVTHECRHAQVWIDGAGCKNVLP